jgi:hypothetical protein
VDLEMAEAVGMIRWQVLVMTVFLSLPQLKRDLLREREKLQLIPMMNLK